MESYESSLLAPLKSRGHTSDIPLLGREEVSCRRGWGMARGGWANTDPGCLSVGLAEQKIVFCPSSEGCFFSRGDTEVTDQCP